MEHQPQMDQLKADSYKVLLRRNAIVCHWVFASLQLECTNSRLRIFL